MPEEFEHSPQDPAEKKRDWYSVVYVSGFAVIVGALVLMIWVPASFRVGDYGISWYVLGAGAVGVIMVLYGIAGRRKVNRAGRG